MNKNRVYSYIFMVFVIVFILVFVLIQKDFFLANEKTIDNKDSNDEQTVQLQEELKTDCKYVSILGDSLSTYEGVSNSGTPNISTTGYNAWYNGAWSGVLKDWTETYWGQIISKYEMQLLVNNSCGGNRLTEAGGGGTRVFVDAGYNRAYQLAANTGNLSGTTPDIIFFHMGTNDYIGGVSIDLFKTAYIRTLDTMLNQYPDVEIYCFTLTPSDYDTDWDLLNTYNSTIREVVAGYNADDVVLVDVATESQITTENYFDFTYDGTHYNDLGIAEVVKVLDAVFSARYQD